jgi:hypothetical protein
MIGSVGHGKASLNAAIDKVMAERNPAPESIRKHYIAKLRIWPWSIGVYAANGTKAMDILDRKYGKANIIRLAYSDGDEQPRIRFLTENDIP